MSNNIFVQIASYRDPELLPTIRDCLSKSKNPENLTFGICWQRDESESLEEFANDNRFKVLDYHWSKSKGLCWARSEIQKLWSGEEYTLQLDSHHRFAQDWDEQLLEMMDMTGSDKPILTSYAGMYRPSDNTLLNVEPYKMVASNFTPGGTILFRPHSIEGWENLKKPIPARFVSGHYYFTIGEHCYEYKYDPNIYFAGDEISLSIRSFTLGYDLFHPHKTLVWHEYTREGRTKHWSDFNKENTEAKIVERPWWEMDNESKRRLRHMLQEENNNIDLGIYGLGSVRTHRDYELYAGINFANKKLHPLTIQGVNPPINDHSSWYDQKEIEYTLNIELPKTTKANKFIYLGIEDEHGNVLYRKDITDSDSSISVNFKSLNKPFKSVIWPVDENGEWYDRKDILL
jgi:Glycosyltransferase (GlcNAc)